MKKISVDKIDILALSLIKGIGKKSIFNIVQSNNDIKSLKYLTDEELKLLLRGANKYDSMLEIRENFENYRLEAENLNLQYIENNIFALTYWDEEYPLLFKRLSDPPVIIYVKGNMELLNYSKSIAIVGTRECSDIGAQIASNTASFFGESGFNIVSGLAKGIDTAAHQGALSKNGKTTAILVDVENIIPSENKELAKTIIANGGLLISENAPGSFINKGDFVQRDRLQSGLSVALFAIETDIQGGTMHTVGFALEQNIPIFCPRLDDIENYPKNFSKSRGIRKLINDGSAHPYTKKDYPIILTKLENNNNNKLDINTSQGNLFHER